MFEWDEEKRQATITNRGLDFVAARTLFDGRATLTVPALFPVEDRFLTIAMLDDGKCYAVVWTWRGELRRIISFRRARDGEETAYRQTHG